MQDEHAEDTMMKRIAKSAVRDDTGAVRLVHHATYQDFPAEQIAPFTQFGTRRSERQRAEDFARYIDQPQDARLISAWLDMRNPLEIPDIRGNHDAAFIARLIQSERPDLFRMDEIDRLSGMSPDDAKADLSKMLQDAGIDGLRYRNVCEDPGETSWVILDPKQVILHYDGPISDSLDPWDLSEEDYTGPCLVSDVFSIDGQDEDYEYLWEYLDDHGADLPRVAIDADGWSVRYIPDWEPEGTTILFDPQGNPEGFYTGGQVWINESARGHGRSALMINATADILGGCPAMNTEGMGFSPAGIAAHRSAWEKARAEFYGGPDFDL